MTPTSTGASAITWFAGWAIVLVMLWGMSKFGPTRIILYWLLWLSILWLLLGNAQELQDLINTAFGQFTKSSGEGQPPAPASSPISKNVTNSQSKSIKG